MLATIGMVLGKVGGFAAGLAGSILRWFAVVGAYFLGKRSEQRKQAERSAEIKDDQLKIFADHDLHRGDLLDRMRDRKRGS